MNYNAWNPLKMVGKTWFKFKTEFPSAHKHIEKRCTKRGAGRRTIPHFSVCWYYELQQCFKAESTASFTRGGFKIRPCNYTKSSRKRGPGVVALGLSWLVITARAPHRQGKLQIKVVYCSHLGCRLVFDDCLEEEGEWRCNVLHITEVLFCS